MNAASVDRALIHPVLWDADSNELAVEAVRKYPVLCSKRHEISIQPSQSVSYLLRLRRIRMVFELRKPIQHRVDLGTLRLDVLVV
jgi:hypothetical protein